MACRPDGIPEHFTDLEDIASLYRHGADLGAVSRRGWLSDFVGQLVERFGVSGLAYLGACAAVLDADAVRDAVAGLTLLIRRLDEDPSCLHDLTGQTAFALDEVRRILAGPVDPTGPEHDEGDGDDLLYLAWFLRAHLDLLERARESGQVVLYAQTKEG